MKPTTATAIAQQSLSDLEVLNDVEFELESIVNEFAQGLPSDLDSADF